ncbi:MAG: hypothetical protein K6C14_04855 [Eubacterium sp.]|nr:hypothetical protein [Eubacterium sp.]
MIKKAAAVLSVIVFTVALESAAFYGFKSEPAYETANRWYTDSGKKIELHKFKSDRALTVNLKLKKKYPEGTYLIINKTDLEIFAFTRNKILTESGAGSNTVFIPVWEVLKGETLTLVLTPEKNRTGSIASTVRFQSRNDYYFTLLSDNSHRIIIFSAVTVLLTAFTVKRRYFLSAASATYLITEIYKLLKLQ